VGLDALLAGAGAAIAVTVELVEAMAIVVAVGVSRGWRDATLGALAAGVTCLVIGVLVGPVLLDAIPRDPLRVVIGTLLLLFGLEWLRKGVLRLAGRRARSSARREFLEAREEADALPDPVPGRPDWPARAVAFKGVLLEGVEVVLVVAALAGDGGHRTAVLAGATVAAVAVVAAGAWLRGPIARVPETELKLGVGVLLSTFGVVFLADGAGAAWPGGDLALLYVAAAFLATAAVLVHRLAADRDRVRA
jgi:uncharacterized membrane protein